MPKATTDPNPQHATYSGGPVCAINAQAPLAEQGGDGLLGLPVLGRVELVGVRRGGQHGGRERAYDQAAETNSGYFSEIKGKAISQDKNEVLPQQRAIVQKVSQELQTALAGDKEPEKALSDAQSFIDTVLGR